METLRMNMDAFDDHTEPTIIEDNIREVETKEILEAAGVGVGRITAIFGGPPCQGFSVAGNRDPADERNELYQEMVRIVNRAKPVFFVMENVPGLATMREGEAIQEVCEEFRQCGYDITWDKLNAANFGVPQRRKRVFIIGKRVDVMTQPAFGNPQLHMAAKPGNVHHPEFFREKYDLHDPNQQTLGAYTREPETLDDLLEQVIQKGGS